MVQPVNNVPLVETFKSNCPCCGAPRDVQVLLCQFHDVPVHSTLVLESAAAAHEIPLGQIQLLHCPRCDVLWNQAFDPKLIHYGSGFEESQFGSPTFRRFAEQLALNLTDRHGLRHRTVVELGCGKAEFLSLLCRTAEAQGYGIDPAGDPARLDPGDAGRVTLLTEFYGEHHRDLIRRADFVCCRHTLEHLHDSLGFLRLLRRHLDGRPEVPVYFDVPDTEHVLEEGAFWEANYEHCLCFTATSLANLFEQAGFHVDRTAREYGGQNLLIEARATASAATHPPARGPEASERAAQFGALVRSSVAAWRRLLLAAGRRTVLWGSGSRAVGFLGAVGLGEREVQAVVDINPRRQGLYQPGFGRPILAPAALVEEPPERVIVMNPLYVVEIGKSLEALGLHPEILPVNEPPA